MFHLSSIWLKLYFLVLSEWNRLNQPFIPSISTWNQGTYTKGQISILVLSDSFSDLHRAMKYVNLLMS